MKEKPERKLLKELNLTDRFLFDEVIEDPQTHQDMLSIIFGREIPLLTKSETEKEMRVSPQIRSVRMDVCSMDEERTVYNTEMQDKRKSDLAKRSRYYQAVRIFLNTRGKNDSEVSEELVSFLHYIENTTDAVAENSGSERIKRIHNRVRKVKVSEEVGVKYMQAWEEKYYEREEGREEGRIEGREEGAKAKLQEQIRKKLEKGKSVEKIADELEESTETVEKIIKEMEE